METKQVVFTPKPDGIKTVAVVDLNGRTQTYSSLLSAITAVYGLPQADMKLIEAMIRGRGAGKAEEVEPVGGDDK